MNCTKSDFLRIYMESNIKDLQRKVDGNILRSTNYTPNIDFLNKIWNDYESQKCNSFDKHVQTLQAELSRSVKNSDLHKLNLEKIDFLDKLKFTCNCSKHSSNIKVNKFIKQVDFNQSSIPANGGSKKFVIKGDKNAVFSFYVTNEDSPKKYYNFETNSFTTTKYVLTDVVIEEHSKTISVSFPKVTDDDHYDITVFANPEYDTFHVPYVEMRYDDDNRTVNVNDSVGSNSALLHKKLYQYTDNTITLTAITPNSIPALSGYAFITNETITATKHGGTIKQPFKLIVTAAATKAYWIKRQPTTADLGTTVQRTIGSAAVPIEGEDISSSTYYRWPIDNALGISNGMLVTGTNVVANSKISDYITTIDIKTKGEPDTALSSLKKAVSSELKINTNVFEGGAKKISKYGNETLIQSERSLPRARLRTKKYSDVTATGVNFTSLATFTNGVATSRPGNITLNKQQPDALKDDTVKIFAMGRDQIESLTGYKVKVTNVEAVLTKPTTTTTSAATSTTIAVADTEGVINKVSRLSGVNISSTSAPLITSGGGSDGSGNWIVDAAQTYESGTTLTVENTGRTVTITGDIEISQVGESDVTIHFNIERFLSAS